MKRIVLTDGIFQPFCIKRNVENGETPRLLLNLLNFLTPKVEWAQQIFNFSSSFQQSHPFIERKEFFVSS